MELPGTTLALVAFFSLAVIVSASRLSVRALPGPMMTLLRALLPSWRFFEDLGFAPELSYRIVSPAGSKELEGPWQPCLEPPRRNWRSAAFNAQGNLRHACASLVEAVHQLLEEVEGEESAGRVERSVVYELVENLVRYRLRELGTPSGAKFQFKIDSVMQGSEGQGADRVEDVLVSKVCVL